MHKQPDTSHLRTCSECAEPMTERTQERIEGIRQFQAHGRCSRCYKKALKTGELGARSRVEYTDTEIKCMKCGEWKLKSAYKTHSTTILGYEYTCRMCGKLVERYNITSAQYIDLFKTQNYKCAICEDPIVPFTRRAHIDHDHACCTGYSSCGSCVRGILCGNCNSGIGFLKDDPAILLKAARYVENKG